MIKTLFAALVIPAALLAQVKNFIPVTQEMLLHPSPNDWLMYSRTYDAQRYSPLKQITGANVGQLAHGVDARPRAGHDRNHSDRARRRDVRGRAGGDRAGARCVERRPSVGIQAQGSCASGRHRRARKRSRFIRTSSFTRLPMVSWSASMRARASSAGRRRLARARTLRVRIVVDGKVISRRGCGKTRDTCFIAAHDALTGKELWKFYNVPAPGEPGSESWGTPFSDTNLASTWGLPGTYDPVRKTALLGHRESDAEHAPGAARRESGRHFAHERRRISTATRRSRSIPRPASSTGITSICRATTGTRITRTNARW